MTTEESFVPIQMEAWPRAQLFYYYTQMAPTSYTVDVTMDVTVLRKELKRRGLKFFPAYLWLMTSTIGGIEELRVGTKDGVLGYWKQLTPAYPQFHEDDKTTSLLWTEYQDNFSVFYENYMKDTKEYAPSHGIVSAKGIPLPNAYVISCIQWFTFKAFLCITMGLRTITSPALKQENLLRQMEKHSCPYPLRYIMQQQTDTI